MFHFPSSSLLLSCPGVLLRLKQFAAFSAQRRQQLSTHQRPAAPPNQSDVWYPALCRIQGSQRVHRPGGQSTPKRTFSDLWPRKEPLITIQAVVTHQKGLFSFYLKLSGIYHKNTIFKRIVFIPNFSTLLFENKIPFWLLLRQIYRDVFRVLRFSFNASTLWTLRSVRVTSRCVPT